MNTDELINYLSSKAADDVFTGIYGKSREVCAYQKTRCIKAAAEFEKIFGRLPVQVYSAPGRSEICGNHTDHQNGLVLAAAISLDTVAIVSPADDGIVRLVSEGYGEIRTDLEDLSVHKEEAASTSSIIRGVAAGFKNAGYEVGGFCAYAVTDVLSGSGLSSSAAFEVLVGNIFSGLYNGGRICAADIAKTGRFAENRYFGKPSGLMDQMACAEGGLVYFDFKDPEDPVAEKLQADFNDLGLALCILDTKSSHADLTADYAAVPSELAKVSAFFGKNVLRDVDEELFYKKIPELRKTAGDRAILRAAHIFNENRRVETAREAILKGDAQKFLQVIRNSGRSSHELLQNVTAPGCVHEQSLALALMLSRRIIFEDGAVRVHGGGFAGTIQAFVPCDMAAEYKRRTEEIFGEGSCYVLSIRDAGGIRVI